MIKRLAGVAGLFWCVDQCEIGYEYELAERVEEYEKYKYQIKKAFANQIKSSV